MTEWEIRVGDVRDVLRTMEPESVQCVVTSPPYWGLRDYGTAKWEGGDPACEHSRQFIPRRPEDPGIRRSTLGGGKGTTTIQATARAYRHACSNCGAVRQDQQIGLEATPEEYVAVMVDVFREIRRVLRKDGTAWLNMGDSYGSGTRASRDYSKTTKHGYWNNPAIDKRIGSPAKQLLGTPWRVAFALQADGWYLRSDIIWAKPNPMPESVRDRPTKAHEYLFLLTKSERYFYDADAVRLSDSPWLASRHPYVIKGN